MAKQRIQSKYNILKTSSWKRKKMAFSCRTFSVRDDPHNSYTISGAVTWKCCLNGWNCKTSELLSYDKHLSIYTDMHWRVILRSTSLHANFTSESSSLKWLNTVSGNYIWMGRYNHSLSLDATIMVPKNCSIICEQEKKNSNNVKKMMTTCSPMIEQFFDTMTVASSEKEWL